MMRKIRKLLFVLAIGTLMLASSKSYRVNLLDPALLGNTELTPGEYRVQVINQMAVLQKGKVQTEAPVRVENVKMKYRTTSVIFTNGDGRFHIQEIHLGGTTMKLVFEES